jgi:hypothetical protein
MKIEIAQRNQQKMRLAIMGRSGSGKTYSALLIAYGLCGDWSKIVLIDSEDGSASLYSHLGPFNTIQIGEPFTSATYQEAFELAHDAGKEVIIIDSLSPEWIGKGGIMEKLNTSEWQIAITEHRYILSGIRRAECHVICTLRTRQRLGRFNTNGRGFWETIELPLQQEGIEYLFTTVLRLDKQQNAHIVKDRTGVFTGKDPCPLEVDHGAFLYNWCKKGEVLVPEDLQRRINACTSQTALQKLLFEEDLHDASLIEAFTKRRLELEGLSPTLIHQNEGPRPAA